jgi:hypothetical protein
MYFLRCRDISRLFAEYESFRFLLVSLGFSGSGVSTDFSGCKGSRRDAMATGLSGFLRIFPGSRGAEGTQKATGVSGPGFVRQKVSYQSEPGARVPAYLLLPDAAAQDAVAAAASTIT